MTIWQSLREAFCVRVRHTRVIRETREKLATRPKLEAVAFANAYFPMEKRGIAARLWEIVREHSVANITGIVPSDRFVEDLKMDELDSMSLMELTIDLEVQFKISIPGGRLKDIRTFGQLVDEIHDRTHSA